MFSYKFFVVVVNKSRDGKKLLYPRMFWFNHNLRQTQCPCSQQKGFLRDSGHIGCLRTWNFSSPSPKVEWSLPPSFSPSLPSFFPFSFLPSFLSISFSVSVSLYLYLSPYHRENRFSKGRRRFENLPQQALGFCVLGEIGVMDLSGALFFPMSPAHLFLDICTQDRFPFISKSASTLSHEVLVRCVEKDWEYEFPCGCSA